MKQRLKEKRMKLPENSFSLLNSMFSIGLSVAGLVSIRKMLKEVNETTLQFEDYRPSENDPFISVIIPARNEETVIEKCLKAVLAQNYPNFEVIVVDDDSNDQTPRILKKLATQYSQKLKIVLGTMPLNGWTGKTNALWQGYTHINKTSKWVLFLDADTLMQPGTLGGAVKFAQSNKLSMLSLAPGMISQNFWTKLLMPEVFKFYTIVAGTPGAKPGSVEEASAIGTFILAQGEAYEATGGHGAVKSQVVEDIELARLFRSKGYTTRQIATPQYLSNHWYDNLTELWEGVSKNMFLVAHKDWSKILAVVGIEYLYGILPTWTLIRRLRNPKPKFNLSLALNLIAVVLQLGLHSEVNRNLQVPRSYIVFYPLAALITSLITFNSAIKTELRKSVEWKGRTIETH
ncbi:MAG TPA: glycosyltransferase [Chloroflexia bacterium]|nr:glycosyltransferase [Chloroflexia bacterium]